MKSGSPSSRESRDLLALKEHSELQNALLIPPDAYAANTGLTGIPEGFTEAVQPLVEDGCIRMRRNDAAFEAPWNGLWTGHFVHQVTISLVFTCFLNFRKLQNLPSLYRLWFI